MKKLLFLSLLLAVVVGCSKDDSPDNSDLDNPTAGQVELKGFPDTNKTISFKTKAKELTVSWGDGVVEEYTPMGVEKELTHSYPNRDLRVITITAKGMLSFDVSEAAWELRELKTETCVVLKELLCYDNLLVNLDISGSPALERLICGQNLLTGLNVSKNPTLTDFYCGQNRLTTLDVSNNPKLEALNCSNNPLGNIDISHNTLLYTLYCYNNQLTSLDISHNLKLERLECYNNQLTSIQVNAHKELAQLVCNDNLLTSLDVSNNTKLQQLSCSNNQLTSINVSNSKELEHLDFSHNKLVTLDISHNPKLANVFCSNNLLPANVLNTIFGYLPVLPDRGYKTVTVYGNPGADTCDRTIAEKKAWQVV